MSYGGHGAEHVGDGYSPDLSELSDLRSWIGPSGAVRELDEMLSMMFPVDEVLQRRPLPEGVTEERHEGSIRNSLSFLNTIHSCLDALTHPTPCDRPLSFAEIVYLAGVQTQEGVFNKALAEEQIDKYEYDELMEDLLRAAAEICSAFDLVILKQSLPRQRTGPLIIGELGQFTLRTPSSGGNPN